MTLLYSHNGLRPEPLPFRITLPSGFTRTDPSTFSQDEITAAGFAGPYAEPHYDPATEQLDWVNGSYVVTVKPPQPLPEIETLDLKATAAHMIQAAAMNDPDTLATLLADLLDIAQ